MQTEIARVLRHGLPPLVAYVAAKGWIPADLQQPLIEAAIAVSAFVAAYLASRTRDKRRS